MKRILLAAVLAVTLSLTACGSSGGPVSGAMAAASLRDDGPPEAEEETVFDRLYAWSLSTPWAGDSEAAEMYERFAQLVHEYTGGTVTVTVFPGGVITGEAEAVSAGKLEFCTEPPVSAFSPGEERIFRPFQYPDGEALLELYDSAPWREIREGWASEHNVRDLCGVLCLGERVLLFTREIRSGEELRGARIGTDTLRWAEAWQSWGAEAVLSAGPYDALSGGADGWEGPLEALAEELPALAGALSGRGTYLCLFPTGHALTGFFLPEDLYASLPETYRGALVRAGEEAMEEYAPRIAGAEDTWLRECEESGIAVAKAALPL